MLSDLLSENDLLSIGATNLGAHAMGRGNRDVDALLHHVAALTAALTAALAAERTLADEAATVLVHLERFNENYTSGLFDCCACCGLEEARGHADDCILAAALDRHRSARQPTGGTDG